MIGSSGAGNKARSRGVRKSEQGVDSGFWLCIIVELSGA